MTDRDRALECDVCYRPPTRDTAHAQPNGLSKREPIQEVRIDMMSRYDLNGRFGDGLERDCEAEALDWNAVSRVTE